MNDPHQKDEEKADELGKKIKEAQKASEEKEEAIQTEEVTEKENSRGHEKQIQELKESLARAMADLQNFKRRSEEERMSFVKFANMELLKALLPIFDNLDRSVVHLPNNLKEDNWAKGVVHIHADLIKTLQSLGIEKMKTVGEKLDPKKHEALMSGPGEKDQVIEEFEPGYLINGEILKPAKVKVGDGT